MNAPDLFAMLNRYGPDFGVQAPEGEEAVFWNAYFRELRDFRGPAVEYAMEAWKRGDFEGSNPVLVTIYPTPSQIAKLARAYREPTEFTRSADAFRTNPLPFGPMQSPREVLHAPDMDDVIL